MVDGNDSLRTEIYVIDAVFCFLAFIAVLARVWVRIRVVRAGWGWDDTTILSAMATTIALSYFMAASALNGFGLHISSFAPADYAKLPAALENYYIVEISYVAVITVTKVSICLFYLRLSVDPSFRRKVFVVITLLLVNGLATEACVIFQCIPIERNWSLVRFIYPHEFCFDVKAFWTATGVINIVNDLVVYFLPIPMLWKVNRPRKQRVALVLVFAVGLFVVLAGIVRFALLRKALQSLDIFYDNAPVLMWSSVEINLGLICACLPSLKPILSRYLPHRLAWTYGSGDSHGKESTSANSRHRNGSRPPTKAFSSRDKSRNSRRWEGLSDLDFDLGVGESIDGVVAREMTERPGRNGSEAGLHPHDEELDGLPMEDVDERGRVKEIHEDKEHKQDSG